MSIVGSVNSTTNNHNSINTNDGGWKWPNTWTAPNTSPNGTFTFDVDSQDENTRLIFRAFEAEIKNLKDKNESLEKEITSLRNIIEE